MPVSSTRHLSQFEWHFFGSHHGKGPSDGESGVIKSKAARLVLSGQYVIDDSLDLHHAIANELTILDGVSLRHVYHVPSTQIKEEQDNMAMREKTAVTGIRKWHHIRSHGITESVSCTCGDMRCMEGVPNPKKIS